MIENDRRYMALALSLGERGLGQTWPNPAVGCVIVKDEKIVGRGWTQPGGRPHAETQALAQAGVASKGATVYVTLEPCCHTGKTPPCARALIDAEVSRVVIACSDPDPRVSGGGIKMLEAADITVDVGLMELEAIEANAGFISKVIWGRPWITLKMGASIDGKIATQTGESQWITSAQSRRLVHAYRATHDAVLVGGGTARADDPSLTVRKLGVERQPVRIVATKSASILPTGQLMSTAQEVPVWIVHGPSASKTELTNASMKKVKLLETIETPDGQLDLSSMMGLLAEQGLTRVFCEGGSQFAASLLREGLVDELITFSAGVVLGEEGLPCLGELGILALDTAPRFTLHHTRTVGGDVLQVWRRDS